MLHSVCFISIAAFFQLVSYFKFLLVVACDGCFVSKIELVLLLIYFCLKTRYIKIHVNESKFSFQTTKIQPQSFSMYSTVFKSRPGLLFLWKYIFFDYSELFSCWCFFFQKITTYILSLWITLSVFLKNCLVTKTVAYKTYWLYFIKYM